MEAIVWILSVYHNACTLPSWSFSCPFGAVCLFDFIFQGLLKEMRWLQMLREGSIWYRHPGSLPRGSSNSAGESPKIALPESWPPLSTPQDCNDTSFFYLGIPKLLDSGSSGCLISQCGLERLLTQPVLICSYVWPRLHLPHNHILFHYLGIMAAWTI